MQTSRTSSGSLMPRPARSMSAAISRLESAMPSGRWRSGSTAASAPPLIQELPPAKSRFSIRITEQPARAASMVAAKPANPLPTTTTSAVSVKGCNCVIGPNQPNAPGSSRRGQCLGLVQLGAAGLDAALKEGAPVWVSHE